MAESWKITAYAGKERVQAALLEHESTLDWDPEIVLSGCEIAEDKPDDWMLEAWYPRRPRKADKAAVERLFSGKPPKLTTEKLPDVDWVSQSQLGVEPITAGCFHVRTPDYPPRAEPGMFDFVIPASQAFGTGQHETTAGCLAMLTEMKSRGLVLRNIADIGTGTGLLAFAAIDLWPGTLVTASDIDPVCIQVVEDNATLNFIRMGSGRGEVTMMAAAGMDHRLLQARGPYDLLIANILAGPLTELAADFSRAVVPGGHVLLAGLLETQEPTVRAAYRRAGFRLAARLVNGDWSILWLRKRAGAAVRATRPGKLPAWAREW